MSDVSRLLARVDELSAALAEAQRERDDARATYQELATEFERLRDEAELMRPVVEKGRVVVARWKAEGFVPGTGWTTPDADDFAAAVDTYETQTGGTDG